MGKVGLFFLGGFVIVLMARALKPASDALFAVMLNTTTLSPTESFAWRLMPYAIPIILWAILVSVVSGHFGVSEGSD